jgi:hypothetical protein
MAVRELAIAGAYSMVTGRTPPTFDLPGYLELVDRPAEATPVEAMMVSLHPWFLIMTLRLGQTEMANSF